MSWKDELLKIRLQKPKEGDSDWQKEGQSKAMIARLRASKKKLNKVTNRSGKNTFDLYAMFSDEIANKKLGNLPEQDRTSLEEAVKLYFPNLKKKERESKLTALIEARDKFLAVAQEETEKLEDAKKKESIELTIDYIDNLGITKPAVQRKIEKLWADWDDEVKDVIKDKIEFFNTRIADGMKEIKDMKDANEIMERNFKFITDLINGKFEKEKKDELEEIEIAATTTIDKNNEELERLGEYIVDEGVPTTNKREALLNEVKEKTELLASNRKLLEDLSDHETYYNTLRKKLKNKKSLEEKTQELEEQYQIDVETIKRTIYNENFLPFIKEQIDDEIEAIKVKTEKGQYAKPPNKKIGMNKDVEASKARTKSIVMNENIKTVVGDLEKELEEYIKSIDVRNYDDDELDALLGLGNISFATKDDKKIDKANFGMKVTGSKMTDEDFAETPQGQSKEAEEEGEESKEKRLASSKKAIDKLEKEIADELDKHKAKITKEILAQVKEINEINKHLDELINDREDVEDEDIRLEYDKEIEEEKKLKDEAIDKLNDIRRKRKKDYVNQKIANANKKINAIKESNRKIDNINYMGVGQGLSMRRNKPEKPTQKVGSYEKGKKPDHTKTDFSSMSLTELTINKPHYPKKPTNKKPKGYKAKEHITASNTTGEWITPSKEEMDKAFEEFKTDRKVYRKWHRANDKAESDRDKALLGQVLVKLKRMKKTDVGAKIEFAKPNSKNNKLFKDFDEINRIMYLLKDSEDETIKPIIARIKRLLGGNKSIKPKALTAKEKKAGKKVNELTQEQKARKMGLTELVSGRYTNIKIKKIPAATIKKFKAIAKSIEDIVNPKFSQKNTWDASRMQLLLGKTKTIKQILMAIGNNGKEAKREAYGYEWDARQQMFMSKTKETETYGTKGESVVESYYNNSYDNYSELDSAIKSINTNMNATLEGMDDTLLEYITNQDVKHTAQRKTIRDRVAFIKSKKNLVKFFNEQTRLKDSLEEEEISLPMQWDSMYDFIEESVEVTKDTVDTEEELLLVKKHKYSTVIASLETFLTQHKGEEPPLPKKTDKEEARKPYRKHMLIKDLVEKMLDNITEFSDKFNEDLEEDLDVVEELQLEQGSAETQGKAKNDGGN